MNSLKNPIIRILVKRILIPWLRDRALVLPSSKRRELSNKLRVDEEILEAIEEAIRLHLISALSERTESRGDDQF